MTSPARKAYRRIKIVGPDKPGWAASVIDLETGETIQGIEQCIITIRPDGYTLAELHFVERGDIVETPDGGLEATRLRSTQRVHDIQLDIIARQYIEDEEG